MNSKLLYETLFQTLNRTNSIEKIVTAAADILERPLIVADTSFKVLGISPKASLDDWVWDEMLEHGYAPDEMIVRFYQENYMESASQSSAPLIVDWGPVAIHPRIMQTIKIKEQMIGYAALLYQNEKEIPACMEALSVIVQAVQIALRQQNTVDVAGSPLFKVFVRNLFSDLIQSPEQLQLWEENLRMTFPSTYQVLAIRARNSQHSGMLPYLSTALKNVFPHFLTFVTADTLFLLRYSVVEDTVEQHTKQQLVKLLTNFQAVAALGPCFPHLAKIIEKRQQVEKLLDLGTLLAAEEVIYDYNDFFTALVLAPPLQGLALSSNSLVEIARIESWDQTHHTNYLQTLQTYILAIGNHAVVTQQLHIHRNTLNYRLRKIEEVLQLDLADSATFFKLLLYFQLMVLKEKLQQK